VHFLIFAKTLNGFSRLTMIAGGAPDHRGRNAEQAMGFKRCRHATSQGRGGSVSRVRAQPRSLIREDAMAMDDHVYRIIEISGSSQSSIEDAIQNAVGRAGRTLRNLRWFEVLQTRGHLEGGKVEHYQVVLKIGFTIDDTNIGA
jgi:flavin-binding protein dodecin